MKNTIEYSIKDNHINIPGTNEGVDMFTTLQCWPKKGVHAGIYKWVDKYLDTIIDKLDHDKSKLVKITSHSLGGAIAQEVGRRLVLSSFTNVYLETCGSFPIYAWWVERPYGLTCKIRIYGNDPIPRLFPKFSNIDRPQFEGPKRKWYKFSMKDHQGYYR